MLGEPQLSSQVDFLIEIDKLKSVERQTRLMNGTRQENTAEHSWHLGMLALVLSKYSAEPIDLLKTLKILMIHDLVEIDAGDTFGYDAKAAELQHEKEKIAADRIFGMLPNGQGDEYHKLWLEYEHGSSAEARFARALDRFHPLLHNFQNKGGSWLQHDVREAQVLKRIQSWAKAAPKLEEYALWMVKESVRLGYLNP